jgi:cytochrome c556
MPVNLSMMRRIALGAAGLAIAFAVVAAVPAQQAGGKPRRSRAEFMRMKLEYSKTILEGLALEDYEKISKNAKALRQLSEAADWELPKIPNAGDYVIFTTEFQRLTNDMERQAKAKNIDGATLAYLRMTMNCVTCHKYVREAAK